MSLIRDRNYVDAAVEVTIRAGEAVRPPPGQSLADFGRAEDVGRQRPAEQVQRLFGGVKLADLATAIEDQARLEVAQGGDSHFVVRAVSAGGHDEVKRLMGAAPRAVPFLWSYAEVIEPILVKAAKLVTTVESERRSLILVNPGLAPRRSRRSGSPRGTTAPQPGTTGPRRCPAGPRPDHI